MNAALVAGIVVVALVVRVAVASARRRRRAATAQDAAPATATRFGALGAISAALHRAESRVTNAVGMVAGREIKERLRGRIFQVGTAIVLLVVAAAIVIPSLQSASAAPSQTVGVVGGPLSIPQLDAIALAGKDAHDRIHFVTEPTRAAANAALRQGRIDVAVVDGTKLVLNESATLASSPADPTFVSVAAAYLGVVKAAAAYLKAGQIDAVVDAKPVPTTLLHKGAGQAPLGVSVIGIVLLFIMLTQYCTWILIGVMQEKNSRVVELLLSTIRPIQLLAGKVIGIGLVALLQAALVVGTALIVADAVGSSFLSGTGTVLLLAEVVWLLLGYFFYCWVYAAAGSMAERQDQIQTLAFPLSIPILISYIYAITVASSGSAPLLFKVLAYVPLSAPFCMSVLVGLHEVTWWQFACSVAITLASTYGIAHFAAGVYRRAILKTRGQVRLRELLGRSAAP